MDGPEHDQIESWCNEEQLDADKYKEMAITLEEKGCPYEAAIMRELSEEEMSHMRMLKHLLHR